MLNITEYFYVFIVLGILGVLISRQTIYSLLYLVGVFVSSAVIWVAISVELIGLILIIVYIGAVTMLLLYMVMFLDSSRPQQDGKGLTDMECMGIGLIITALYFNAPSNFFDNEMYDFVGERWMESTFLTNDIAIIAINLFEQHAGAVIFVGFILLIAMVVALDIASIQKEDKGSES